MLFKVCWDLVKHDMASFVNVFHLNSKLHKAVTTSFLTLIPKADNPQGIEEFRPICLVGSHT